jgi:hypothetical protein
MKILLAVLGAMLLLALAAFCLFGSLATFEPTDTPAVSWALRVGYAVVGIGSLAGTFTLCRRLG